MRKMFLGAAAAMLIAGSAAAQSSATYSMRVGANWSMPGGSADGAAGFMAAGAMDWMLNPSWSLQPELNYNDYRVKVGTVTSSSNFLNVPVLLKYNMPESGGTMKWSLMAGPQLDYTLEDVPSGADKSWIGVAGGVANEMKHGATTWITDLRYNKQMTHNSDFGALAISLGIKF